MTAVTAPAAPTAPAVPPARRCRAARNFASARRWGLRGAVGVVLATALATAAVTLPDGTAGAGTDPEALLRRAREASARTSVAGTVEVRWRDGATVHVERTGARARGGAYVVGRDRNVAVGVGGLRWAADDGVATRWGRVDGAEPPPPGAVWTLELHDTAEVAGRPAYVVVARDGDGPVRARFFVDRSSGILLRRDVLQRDGDLDRSVRFTKVRTGDIRPALPPLPESGPKAVPTDEVASEFAAPERLAGFRLLGRYEHPDGAVQLFYSDGLFSLSVFEQAGLVDWSSLPDGGNAITVGSERARSYATDAGSVVVWGRDGLVLTSVSDAPPDTVLDAVAGVATAGHGILDDVVDFVLEPFDWD